MDYHPTEDAPKEMLAVVRHSFRADIEKAEQLYPGHKVQVLVILSRNDRERIRPSIRPCPTCERMIDLQVREQGVPAHFMAMLAGNPHFCDSRGCLLAGLDKKDEETAWTRSWSYQSNGHIRFTDQLQTIVETRLGCELHGPRAGDLREARQPCEDWADRFNEEKAINLSRELRLALYQNKIRIYKFRADGTSMSAKVSSIDKLDPAKQIVGAFAKKRGLDWQVKGQTLFISFKPFPVGLYYHDKEDYPVRWISE